MSPLFKLFLVILAIGIGGVFIASKVEAQEPEYTMDDFKHCSLLMKNRIQTADLINEQINIMNQASIDLAEVIDMANAGQITRDQVEALERQGIAIIKKHEKAGEVAIRRGELFNKLTNEYNKSCYHPWPLIIVDTACEGEPQELTKHFCEELKYD